MLKVFPVKERSPKRVMLLAEVSCHICAVPLGRKLVNVTLAGAALESCLLMTTNVSAPSVERVAAKVATVSGFGAVAEMLVSPKADWLPS